MVTTLSNPKLLLLGALVIILLVGMVVAQFAQPAKNYGKSINTKSDALASLGYQTGEKKARYIAVDKYAMSEPFSSELLIISSKKTSKADLNKNTR